MLYKYRPFAIYHFDLCNHLAIETGCSEDEDVAVSISGGRVGRCNYLVIECEFFFFFLWGFL